MNNRESMSNARAMPENAGEVATLTPTDRSWVGRRIILFVFFLALAGVLAWQHRLTEAPNARWDFDAFYTAAQLIRHGQAARLYDLSAQADLQASIFGSEGLPGIPARPFLNPPAAALIFLPLAWLPPLAAYYAWTLCNLLLLFASILLLQRHVPLPPGDWALTTAFMVALFTAPASFCLVTGQTGILILFLYTVGYVLMRNGRWFLAGCAIGLVALKFQLLVGFVVVMVLRRCWKFVAGAAVSSAAVAALSTLVVGWRAMLAYPPMLRRLAQLPHVAWIVKMFNVRGILWQLIRHEPSLWLVAALSAGLLVCAALVWKDTETGFCIALIASVLTAYHLHEYDLTVALIPLAVIGRRVVYRARTATVALGLIALPLLTWIPAKVNVYWLFAVLVMALGLAVWLTRPLVASNATS